MFKKNIDLFFKNIYIFFKYIILEAVNQDHATTPKKSELIAGHMDHIQPDLR